MRDFRSLSGKWDVRLLDGSTYSALLPGTLDTNKIGHEDKLTGKLHQDENYVENKALVSDDVIEAPTSLVIPEAANREISATVVLKRMLKAL